MLDLYDADDDYDAELYRSRQSEGDVNLLPLQPCARTAVRNLELRKSMSAGFLALTDDCQLSFALRFLPRNALCALCALRGIATVSRPSVRLSVCLSVRP